MNKEGIEIDELLICPISLCIMKDPVMAPTSENTFERYNIEQWIDENGTDPLTRDPLTKDKLVPNRAIKSIIDNIEND
jgi:hypothetical protein